MTPQKVLVTNLRTDKEEDGELVGFLVDERDDIVAVVRINDKLLLEMVHPSRIRIDRDRL